MSSILTTSAKLVKQNYSQFGKIDRNQWIVKAPAG
jgi:hypothetical protein